MPVFPAINSPSKSDRTIDHFSDETCPAIANPSIGFREIESTKTSLVSEHLGHVTIFRRIVSKG